MNVLICTYNFQIHIFIAQQTIPSWYRLNFDLRQQKLNPLPQLEHRDWNEHLKITFIAKFSW